MILHTLLGFVQTGTECRFLLIDFKTEKVVNSIIFANDFEFYRIETRLYFARFIKSEHKRDGISQIRPCSNYIKLCLRWR